MRWDDLQEIVLVQELFHEAACVHHGSDRQTRLMISYGVAEPTQISARINLLLVNTARMTIQSRSLSDYGGTALIVNL